MSILVDQETRVLVQNITGREGSHQTRQMLAYGTKIVSGTAPGKGGREVEGVPVFESVKEAVEATGANASIIFVPAAFAPDAIIEAADSGLDLIVCITEGIPVLDMIKVCAHVRARGSRLLGPNCPGAITPGACKLGIMPAHVFLPGPVGLVSRSGTLTYELAAQLSARGVGQSTCVGIGGDPIAGMSFTDVLALFEKDPATEVIAMIGEIGGAAEEAAAAYIAERVTKPVVAFVAGKTAPPGRRMGHAGAIVSVGQGTAAGKITALREAGVIVEDTLESTTEAISALVNEVRSGLNPEAATPQ